MATSNTLYSNDVGNLRLCFYWYVSGNTVNWQLYTSKDDSGYRVLWGYELYINGSIVSSSSSSRNIYDGTVIDNGAFNINTNYFEVELNAGVGQISYNCSIPLTGQSPDVYANFTSLEVQSKTVNSITFKFTTDRAASIYAKNNTDNTSWLNNGNPFISNVTSGTFTIYYADRENTTRLTPNKTYEFTMLCRDATSQLDRARNITDTTYQIAKISSAPNINHGNSETVTYSNPSGATINISIQDTGGTTFYANYRSCSGSSYTFNFTDTELDTLYKLYGNNNSIVVRVYLRTTQNNVDYWDGWDITITLKGNQKTMKTNVSNSWKRRKNLDKSKWYLETAVLYGQKLTVLGKEAYRKEIDTMDDKEKEILLLKQEFKSHRENSDRQINELFKKTEEQEKRIIQLEMNNTKTDLQYAQIIETLKKLNDKTIPELTIQVEELKNKPVKRYETIVGSILGAICGAIGGAIVGIFVK